MEQYNAAGGGATESSGDDVTEKTKAVPAIAKGKKVRRKSEPTSVSSSSHSGGEGDAAAAGGSGGGGVTSFEPVRTPPSAFIRKAQQKLKAKSERKPKRQVSTQSLPPSREVNSRILG